MSDAKLPPEKPDEALPEWLQLEGVDLSAFKAEHRLEDLHPPSDLEITVFGSPKKLKEQALAEAAAEASDDVLAETEVFEEAFADMPSTSEGLPLVIEEYVEPPRPAALPEPIFSNFNPLDSQFGLERLLKLPEQELAKTLDEIELPEVEDVEMTPVYRRPTPTVGAPYLTFMVAEWTMALAFDQVQEVTRVPHVGEKFLDLRTLLKLPPPTTTSERRMLLLASSGVGLVIDRVLGLRHLGAPTSSIPEALSAFRPFISGTAELAGRWLVLLDAAQLTSRDR